MPIGFGVIALLFFAGGFFYFSLIRRKLGHSKIKLYLAAAVPFIFASGLSIFLQLAGAEKSLAGDVRSLIWVLLIIAGGGVYIKGKSHSSGKSTQ